MCRFTSEVNGVGEEAANDALSFVPAADNVLVYERRFAAGAVEVGSKFAVRNSPVPNVVPTCASLLFASVPV
jgi:hypothetical protein